VHKARPQEWEAAVLMVNDSPVIIQVALNGMTTKDVNPAVPRTPAEVAADGIACVAEGAAIIHTHTDDPNYGGTGVHDPEPYVQAWTPILDRYPDAIVYPTIEGGGPHTSIEQRTGHIRELHRRGLLRCSIADLGTSNTAGLDEHGVPTATDSLFVDTVGDAHYLFDFYRRQRLGAIIGITEPGAMRVLMGFDRRGLVPQGSLVQLGFLGPRALVGLPPTPAALDLYLDMMDGSELPWLVAGDNPIANGLAEYALERGGHIRVGLEDAGAAGTTNIDMVRQAVQLAEKVGRPVASPRQAADILGLPRHSYGYLEVPGAHAAAETSVS
jgi:uncharacterized protein (DUF849 family)